jgi:hypothetical protein
MLFSLILPVYNEAKTLENCVKRVRETFEKNGVNYEIIIAEDGSTDGTDRIAVSLVKKYKNITYVHHDKKLGRGKAFSMASKLARGDSVGFIDVDLATKVDFLKDLVKYSKKYDVVTGSRYIAGAKQKRPPLREFVSKVYNWLIRVLVGVKIYDTQCGFKAFSKRFIRKEINKVKESTWAWDAAILVHAIKKGYSFKEFPVVWNEKRGAAHSASLKRILSDIKIHGRIVVKMFLKWRLGLPVEI